MSKRRCGRGKQRFVVDGCSAQRIKSPAIYKRLRAFFRASYIQKRRAADLAVAAELSGAADGLRSTRAAEYGRDIDERYGATGLWKLGGDVAAGAGQMLPTIGINAVTGGTMGMPWLFSSAAGNAAAQARAGGADEETAFLYGILSGGVEAATERISAGIPGLNKTGLLDEVLSRVASSPTGRGAVKKLVDVWGVGAEVYISEFAGAYLARLWTGVEGGAWQTFVETQPDALYAGFVGTLTSAVMNLPGAVKDGRAGRVLDKASDAAQSGRRLTAEQIGKANKAAQRLDAVGSEAWYDVNMSKYADGLFGSNAAQPAAEAGTQPVRAGRNTAIQKPYTGGPVPKVKKGAQYAPVAVADAALHQANAQIEAARAQTEQGKGFKKSLTNFYRETLGSLFNGRSVPVENVNFEDRPYDVVLNKSVIEKVISDRNLSAEKLAVFNEIENVVRNAEYVGSGEYTAHGAKTKPVTRYDYFETQANIGGQEYTVSFDVEVYPERNNYRTHRVINNLNLRPADGATGIKKEGLPLVSAVRTAYSVAGTGPAPAATERGSSPSVNSIAQTEENATGFSGPAAERTSDVSAVPPALNPAPRLYTRAEVQGMSAREVRENYDAIQESMRRGFAVGAPARRSRDGNGKIAAPVGPVTGRAVSRSEMEADLRPTSAFGTKTGSCCKARRRRWRGAWRWKRGGPAKQTWTGWSIWRARRKWSCNMCSSRAAGCRPRCRAGALR